MSVRKIGPSWWVDFRFKRKRYRVRSPENSRNGALAHEATLRRNAEAGLLPCRVPARRVVVPATFEEAAREWLRTHVCTNLKASMYRNCESALRVHLLPRFGTHPLADITAYEIERYKADKVASGLAAKTINNHLAILSKLLKCGRDWGWVGVVPRIVWLKAPPPSFDYLSPAESRRLLVAARGSRWHDMVLCALRTGMRLGELLGLRWTDVDLDHGTLTVRRAIVRGIEGTPKNNKTRSIPLTDDLEAALRARDRRGEFVFSKETGEPLTLGSVQKGLVTCRKRAGLRRFGWHVLRHAFASQLANEGAPIPTIQVLLGHGTIQMTMRYAHIAPSSLRAAVSLLRPAEDRASALDSECTNRVGQAVGQDQPIRAASAGEVAGSILVYPKQKHPSLMSVSAGRADRN